VIDQKVPLSERPSGSDHLAECLQIPRCLEAFDQGYSLPLGSFGQADVLAFGIVHMVRERKATEYFTEREGDRCENQWKMPELMAAEGDLRISFRTVRVCTIEQTTLMEACNMRKRP